MPEPDKHAAAQQAVDILHEISTILVRSCRPLTLNQMPPGNLIRCLTASQNCHLDRRTLSICISMIERGVNPEALAELLGGADGAIMDGQQVIKELRQEAQQVEQPATTAAAAARRR
ncbi:hypothetical protein ACJZ2D_006446 [Fusarium nematophilum]